MGSLRNIALTDTSGEKVKIDLYNFLRDTQSFKEPLISTSSRLHVNDIGATVAVTGFVGSKRIFESTTQFQYECSYLS